jgi:hypothetical protein
MMGLVCAASMCSSTRVGAHWIAGLAASTEENGGLPTVEKLYSCIAAGH